jgi:uncharacterized protein (DUF1810 family)
MMKTIGLERFVEAQDNDYNNALREVINGRKQTHWMWYIFPQIQGLGYSETAKYYAIRDLEEATKYLNHQVLGERLLRITAELLKLESSAAQIFGSPDDLKLRSSMTLFAAVQDASPLFEQVLGKFFNGRKDEKTLNKILKHNGKQELY